MFELLKPVDLDAAAAISIAAGMRKMAMSDDDVHPSEVAMIEQFLNDVKTEVEEGGGDISNISADDVDVNSLKSDELKETFLISLAMVALADGVIREEEVALLQEYVDLLGYPESARAIIGLVGRMLLSQFSGVKDNRAQAEEIGRALGLDENTIAEVLN